MRPIEIADLYDVVHFARSLRRLVACGLAASLTALFVRPAIATPPADAALGWPPAESRFAPAGTPVAPGLAVGDVLDTSNATAAAGLLPPEILRHYENGSYRNTIASWPDGLYHRSSGFERASAENRGRYALDPDTGTIVDAATGAPAADVYGLPFPEIAADDPDGGLKAVWNHYHSYWNSGSRRVSTSIVWTHAGVREREATLDSFFQFYENQEPAYRIPNTDGYAVRTLSEVKTPADLRGSVSLSYRYLDSDRRDTLWAYVPSLRRVRIVNASNRSDGMFGTDLSLDDSHFFDAKPEDFQWRTVGLREGLAYADPRALRGELATPVWTGNGWRTVVDGPLAVAGYQVPDWMGSAWAPVAAVLVKRRFWVVEAVPRDLDYLFGKIELWIDAEAWTGAWSRKFSWKGEIVQTYQIAATLPVPLNDPATAETQWVPNNPTPWQCMEAIQRDRATLAGIRTDEKANGVFRTRIPEDLFNVQVLTRLGR